MHSEASKLQESSGVDAKTKGREVAVWRHDVFNVFALGALNVLNFRYLFYGEGFSFFWWASMAYFLLDFLWVAVEPGSVKSPVIICAHHVVAAIYALIPVFCPEQAINMSYIMTVEVNTWLLVAKRVQPSRVLTWLFYITWVAIRNVFFPYLVWVLYLEYVQVRETAGSPWHPLALAPVFQAALCVLNYKWTWELVCSLRRRAVGTGKSHQL